MICLDATLKKIEKNTGTKSSISTANEVKEKWKKQLNMVEQFCETTSNWN